MIWTRFLWHVSRLRLSLVPTHPDRVGGLGFLSNSVYAFSVLVVAHGAMVSSQIANRIFFLGAKLPEFEGEIATIVIFLLCVIFGPLRRSCHSLRKPSARVCANTARWLRATSATSIRNGCGEREAKMKCWWDPLISSHSRIWQTLSKLVRWMRLVLVTKDAILQLGVALNCAAPTARTNRYAA